MWCGISSSPQTLLPSRGLSKAATASGGHFSQESFVNFQADLSCAPYPQQFSFSACRMHWRLDIFRLVITSIAADFSILGLPILDKTFACTTISCTFLGMQRYARAPAQRGTLALLLGDPSNPCHTSRSVWHPPRLMTFVWVSPAVCRSKAPWQLRGFAHNDPLIRLAHVCVALNKALGEASL